MSYFSIPKKITEDSQSIPSAKSNRPISNNFWIGLITIMLVLPISAIFITQMLRGHFFLPDYDSPLRFLLALPIFYVALKSKFNFMKYWPITIAIAIFITFLSLPWIPKYYGLNFDANNARLGTYFIDPLTFGRITLTFGVLLLFTVSTLNKDKWLLTSLKFICTGIAFYLSIKSGSRTGWMALPFAMLVLLWLHCPKRKIKATFFAVILSIAASVALYYVSTTAQSRIDEAAKDLNSYQMYSMNGETSVGERISFARMAWYYFKIHPFTGWGHTGIKSNYDDLEISRYADVNTRHHPAEGGMFHNELTTNMVTSGILGAGSIILLFFGPLFLFISTWRKGVNIHLCAFGIAYVFFEFISSLSTEVFALKFTASFYAIMISCLCANVLSLKTLNNIDAHNS